MRIFPEINIEKINDCQFTLKTILRKKFEGKYYQKEFSETYIIPDNSNNENEIISLSNRFLFYVYTNMLYSLKDKDYTLDENQMHEGERILGLITFKEVKHTLSNYEI